MRKYTENTALARGPWQEFFKGSNPLDFQNPSKERLAIIRDRLSRLRHYFGFTMKDMGKVLGMTAQGYRSIESNKDRKSLSVEYLFRLAKLLKTTPDYLVGRTDAVDHIISNGRKLVLPAYYIESGLSQDGRSDLSIRFADLYDKDNELYRAILYGLELDGARYDAFSGMIISAITCIKMSESIHTK